MQKFGKITLAAGFLWAFLLMPRLSGANTPTPECASKILSAAFELVERDFPGREYRGLTIPAMNDAICEGEEYMANIVIVVELVSGKNLSYSYAIFHIHVSPGGKLVSAANFLPVWQPSQSEDQSEDGWRRDWCDIIKSVYPEESKKQECE